MVPCGNCHKEVELKDLVDASYKGWEMFVCKECKDFFEKMDDRNKI